MVAVSLMFTIISLHKQAKLEKAREPGPPVCKQLKIGVGRRGRGGGAESEKRFRDKGESKRGV